MWKTLTRNPNYEVSDAGEVRSLRLGRVLSPKRNWDGYLRVQLWSHNKCEFVSIHRLVAEEFLPREPHQTVVNHKNAVKHDNRAENLEWCTQRENIHHAWRNGLAHHPKNLCGLPMRQYTKSGEFICEYPSQREAERITGINANNIGQAARRNGTAGGFRWVVAR